MTKVTQHRFEPLSQIHIASPFRLQGRISEAPPGGEQSLIGCHSAGFQIVGALGQVESKLPVDIPINSSAPENVSQVGIPVHKPPVTHVSARGLLPGSAATS